MHEIYFYKSPQGDEPVLDYIKELAKKQDKDSKVKLRKIHDYIKILAQYGKQAGEPYVKHLEGEIWELRPMRDRIFFVGWMNDSYILLHSFLKKTQKTPAREIEKAKRELADLMARGSGDEKQCDRQ